jgi:hypothetical protein
VYSIYTVNVEVKDVSNRSFNNIARLSVFEFSDRLLTCSSHSFPYSF